MTQKTVSSVTKVPRLIEDGDARLNRHYVTRDVDRHASSLFLIIIQWAREKSKNVRCFFWRKITKSKNKPDFLNFYNNLKNTLTKSLHFHAL